jgi:hypothetical protein
MGAWETGEEGGAMGSWCQARDQQGWRFATMDKELTFQVRDFLSFIIKICPTYIITCICVCLIKIGFLVQITK